MLVKDQNFKKCSNRLNIPYILACYLQIDADPVPGPAYSLDAGLDPHPA
jgi:hypothetical protein